MDCIFCKIINNEIPAKKIYEDEKVMAFYDTSPIAPFHALIIPKVHIESNDQLTSETSQIVAHIFITAAKIAQKNGLKDGYRIINNCGKNGGQTVQHLHFHLLGGNELSWERL